MSKVLFHLNDQNKVEATLRNIENLLEDSDEDIEIELVVHSEAVYSFIENKINNLKKINTLIDKGINISICKNTLSNSNLKKEDFIPGISIVSSGMGEITRKQAEGWLYIKP